MTCSVCLDAMDMIEFEDPRDKTETCFKLECGHAYHTACIIRFLSNSNHSCLHCNGQKTPGEELTIKGLREKLRREISRRPEIREIREEYNLAHIEYSSSVKALKSEISEYVKRRISETKLIEKRNYWQKTETTLKAEGRKLARGMGPRYVGAALDVSNFYRCYQGRWKHYRELHPRFGMCL